MFLTFRKVSAEIKFGKTSDGGTHSVHVEVLLRIEFRATAESGHLAGDHRDRSAYHQHDQFHVEHHGCGWKSVSGVRDAYGFTVSSTAYKTSVTVAGAPAVLIYAETRRPGKVR